MKLKRSDVDLDFADRKKKVLAYDVKYIKPFIQAFYPETTPQEFRKIYNFKYYASFDHDILRLLEDVIERIEIAKLLGDPKLRQQVKELLNSKLIS